MAENVFKDLVTDTIGFFKNVELQRFAENIYTVQGAVDEIRDCATRQRLQVLPYTLLIREPRPECIKSVSAFSKRTGEFNSLSQTDLKLIALTYQLHVDRHGTSLLRAEPIESSWKVVNEPVEKLTNVPGFFLPQNKCVHNNDSKDQTEDFHEDEVNPLDEGDWIGEENLPEARQKLSGPSVEAAIAPEKDVVCLTGDYSMQNVLIQMGLKAISIEGRLLREVRSYALHCYGCMRVTPDPLKQFCPHCGNSTLEKVAVSVSADTGCREYRLCRTRPISRRGTKFSLPAPRGGKHSNNPRLSADQPMPQQKPSRASRTKLDVFDADYVALESPFAMRDVTSRAARLGIRSAPADQGVRRRNPNQNQGKLSGRRKR